MRKREGELLFTELLRSALWGETISIPALRDEQYKEVMIIARKQRMEAMIGEVLIRQQVRLGRGQVAHLLGIVKATERENSRMNQLLTVFTEDLCRHGIRYYVVKGQVVGTYYPSPLMRAPGDIDIFLSDGSYAAAMVLAEKEGMTVCEGNERGKHKVMINEGVVFELHRRLLLPATLRHRREWLSFVRELQQHGENVMIDNCCVCTLPVAYHLVYVFMHLFFHLITGGVGMRQLCDMAVLLKRGDEENIDWQMVVGKVAALGCLKAFRAVVACCVVRLGLPIALPVGLRDSDYRWGERVYRRMMSGGNFGCGRRRVRSYGWLHRLETGWMVLGNVLRFWWLAPKESLLRIALPLRGNG